MVVATVGCSGLNAFSRIASARWYRDLAFAYWPCLDTNSRNGIGNHDNQLVPLQSAALSASVAQQYGIKVGDSFTVTAGGTTYNLQYDDTVPASFTDPSTGQVVQEGPRIDVYDPNNVLGGANSFSAPVSSVNNGATVTSPEGVTTTIPTGTTPSSVAFSSQQQAISGGAALDAISSQFTNATQQWMPVIKGHASTLFWILAAIAAAWTFAVLVIRQADLAELIGAVVRFVFITSFFWWILQHATALPGRYCSLPRSSRASPRQ
jgi:hypothetical protein